MHAPKLVIINKEKISKLALKGVIFDFDDTLIKPPIEWQQIMAEYFIEQIYGIRSKSGWENLASIKKLICENAGITLTSYATMLMEMVRHEKVLSIQTVKFYRDGFDKLWRKVTIDLNTPKDVIKGIPNLLNELKRRDIKIFVVTGGDRAHKVELIKKTGLSRYISQENIFGDVDDRFLSGFSKKKALNYIKKLIYGDIPENTKPKEIKLALIGDGERDMEITQETNGILAIGFNQLKDADVCIYGNTYPVIDLVNLLTMSNY